MVITDKRKGWLYALYIYSMCAAKRVKKRLANVEDSMATAGWIKNNTRALAAGRWRWSTLEPENTASQGLNGSCIIHPYPVKLFPIFFLLFFFLLQKFLYASWRMYT